jgi:hypothetical protein
LSVDESEGGFLFLNAATCERKYDVKPTKRYLRCGRQKFRSVLTAGLDIQYGKQLETFETTAEGEVIAKFRDGSIAKGGLLVGADGNNSIVREGLSLENFKLTPLPVHLVGGIRHLTQEQAAPIRALNPLLFFGMHPETKVFFFFSIQVCVKTLLHRAYPNKRIGWFHRCRWQKLLRVRVDSISKTLCLEEEGNKELLREQALIFAPETPPRPSNSTKITMLTTL